MIVHIEFKDNNGFWKSIKTYKFKYNGKKKPKLGWYFFPYYKCFIKIVKVEDKNYSFKNAKYVKLFFRILLIDKE